MSPVESAYARRSGNPTAIDGHTADTALAHDTLRAAVLSTAFPCVVGASVMRAGRCHFGRYNELGRSASARDLASDLGRFVRTNPLHPDSYTTFVASYREPGGGSERRFERLLWRTLQYLHELDDEPSGWDPTVSTDPNDVHFSFSFAGRAFFVVGMHPAASRWARRTPWQTLVFNAHAQFDMLRAAGRLEPVRRVVRNRDVRLQGFINPALTDFGEKSEARQYAGRLVDEDWSCPLQVRDEFRRAPH